MPKSDKGNNPVKYIHRIIWEVNQVIYIMYPNLYTWYQDPSLSGSPDILFTRLLYYTKRQNRKREIIQPNIYRILPKVNQVFYTFDPICMPNIMILAKVDRIMIVKVVVYLLLYKRVREL